MYIFFGTLIWSCFTVHSSGFSQGKITPGTSSSVSFIAVLTLLKHSTSLSAVFVYIRIPPNNPINAQVPSLIPGYHSFPKWAINTISHKSLEIQPRLSKSSVLVTVGSVMTIGLSINRCLFSKKLVWRWETRMTSPESKCRLWQP